MSEHQRRLNVRNGRVRISHQVERQLRSSSDNKGSRPAAKEFSVQYKSPKPKATADADVNLSGGESIFDEDEEPRLGLVPPQATSNVSPKSGGSLVEGLGSSSRNREASTSSLSDLDDIINVESKSVTPEDKDEGSKTEANLAWHSSKMPLSVGPSVSESNFITLHDTSSEEDELPLRLDTGPKAQLFKSAKTLPWKTVGEPNLRGPSPVPNSLIEIRSSSTASEVDELPFRPKRRRRPEPYIPAFVVSPKASLTRPRVSTPRAARTPKLLQVEDEDEITPKQIRRPTIVSSSEGHTYSKNSRSGRVSSSPRGRQKIIGRPKAFHDHNESSDDEEEDFLPVKPTKSMFVGSAKSKAASRGAKKSEKRRSHVISSQSEDEEDEEDDDFIERDDSFLGKARKPVGEGNMHKKMRSLKNNGKEKRPRQETSNEEDEDDLELDGRQAVLTERLRAPSAKKSKFELLRQARNKKNKSSGAKAQFEGDIEELSSPVEAQESDEMWEELEAVDGQSGMFKNATEDLENFLASEDDDIEGQREVNDFVDQIRDKAQGFKFYVKTYLQWTVHVIICPEVDWLYEDASFAYAHKAVQETINGLLNSLIGSSVWKVPFKLAIDCYPEFMLADLDAMERGISCGESPKAVKLLLYPRQQERLGVSPLLMSTQFYFAVDACLMGGSRHSIFKGMVGGSKYDPKTFEDIDEDSRGDSSGADSEQDSLSNSGSEASVVIGQNGRKRQDDNPAMEFNLGRSCAARAEVYHELKHWGYSMYELLLADLDVVRRRVSKPAASKKGKGGGTERQLRLHAEEADRCAMKLERKGLIPKLAADLLNTMSKATSTYIK